MHENVSGNMKLQDITTASSPVEILMKEHELLLKYANELNILVDNLKEASDFNSAGEKINALIALIQVFKDSASHYMREENVLFPYLEKKGIKQPPRVMWMEHDQIRAIEKKLYKLVEDHKNTKYQNFVKDLGKVASELLEMLTGHYHKENNVLFPTAQQVIGNDEWKEIKMQFNELGYCSFTPKPATTPVEKKETPVLHTIEGGIAYFESGNLAMNQIEAIFNTLPVDVTFIDEEDTVRFFSESKDKIFPRSRAIIGLKVQQCHPQKSLHLVTTILDDFKNGRKDVAEFWIPMGNKFIHIRYFAVRDKSSKYLGCMEVTQDLDPLKKLDGEKRLL